MQRIYLDNAATSWPKPPEVYEAVDRYMRDNGAAAGRGGYAAAAAATELVEETRWRLAQLLGLADASRCVFTSSGTDSLNQAIHGVLRAGDHVVTTVCEHNSVLRPLATLAQQGLVTVDYVACNSQGFVSADTIASHMKPETRLVAVTHASNVTGAIQPVEGIEEIKVIARITEAVGALLLVDAAQTLGHVKIDMAASGIDLLAAPAHKGLLAPTGLGLLAISPKLGTSLQPLRQGGTGLNSEAPLQPLELPDRYEAGNLNVAAIAGLQASLQWLESRPEHQTEVASRTQRLLGGLSDLSGIMCHGPRLGQPRAPVVSFCVPGFDPHEVAMLLESQAGVEARAGLHCAPKMHESLGTAPAGSVRLSPGWATTDDEIDRTLGVVKELAGAVG